MQRFDDFCCGINIFSLARNCFSRVFGAASQTFALGRFLSAGKGKAFVNANQCRVDKCTLRNAITDLEHNDVEI